MLWEGWEMCLDLYFCPTNIGLFGWEQIQKVIHMLPPHTLHTEHHAHTPYKSSSYDWLQDKGSLILKQFAYLTPKSVKHMILACLNN